MSGNLERAVVELRKKLWGAALLPGDPDWAEGCKVWALPLEPITPALVVRARGIVDIQEAVKFAASQRLALSIKGGGHNVSTLGLVEGGVVLDLSLMRGVFVDSKARTCTAEGGCLLGDIDRATSVFGLAVPLGHAPVTGMGLALGGGVGILTHIFGTTAQHIIAATVVLADGSVVEVSQDTDPELLWGLRGAGACLGVVANLTFRLHDVSDAYTGIMILPDDPEHQKFRAIVRFAVDQGHCEPGYSHMTAWGREPDGTPLIILMVVYLGPKSAEEKARFMAPIRQLGPIHDTVGKARYVDTQFGLLEMAKGMPPHYEYWTGGQLPRAKVTDAFLDAYLKCLDTIPASAPLTIMNFDMWTPPPGVNEEAQLDEAHTGPHAISGAVTECSWLLNMGYLDATAATEVKAFANKAKEELGGFGISDAFTNMAPTEDGTEGKLSLRVGGAEKLARLRALKARVDPGNLFRSHPYKGL